MNKRFEWIEPEETARERLKQITRALPTFGRFCLCLVALSCTMAVLAAALLGGDWLFFAEWALFGSIYVIFGLGLAAWLCVGLRVDDSPGSYTLDAEAASAKLKHISYKCSWKDVRSFDIGDHLILPGFRTLTIHHHRAPQKLQLDFRAGQLDEAELRAFVEARLAEARTERLMRRVKQ